MSGEIVRVKVTYKEAALGVFLATSHRKEHKYHLWLNAAGQREPCAGDQSHGRAGTKQRAWPRCPGTDMSLPAGPGDLDVFTQLTGHHQLLLQPGSARVEMTRDQERNWRAALFLQVLPSKNEIHLVPLSPSESWRLGGRQAKWMKNLLR